MTKTTPTLLERVAMLAASTSFDALPEGVVHEARRRLLDTLGCMLAGADGHAVRVVRDGALVLGGSADATLVGDGRRTSADRAALVNCAALRHLDYMDGHPGPYPCHPSFNIPPILAVAEATGASGAEVVRAIVLGYEVNIRLQLGSGDPDISAHGWSGSTNLGISVPAAVGGMLGLPGGKLAHALAISTIHAPALDATGRGQMAESKVCIDGLVALSALHAAVLARAGVTGPLDAFEGSGGFAESVARRFDADLLGGPIERFRILDTYTKRYNAVKCGQTAVAAGLAVCAQLPGGWRDVERLTLRLARHDFDSQMEDAADRRRPENRDTANHSAVYCLAAALVDGDLRPEQFEPHRLRDPEILGLIDRISLSDDPDLSTYWPAANPSEVEIVTRSGEVRRERVLYSPGHPNNPLPDAQIEAKFRGLAASVLGSSAVEEVIGLVGRLETLPSIDGLMALVGARVRAGPPGELGGRRKEPACDCC
jgi:2-methylcitrate dehydratase